MQRAPLERPRIHNAGPLGWAGRLLVAGALAAAAWSAMSCTPLGAQIIPIKSVPLATGSQFLVHPSDRAGMAGAGAALHDSLGGVYSNPAWGHLAQDRIFGAPMHFGISDQNGSGSTLALGASLAGRAWAGTASVALQQLSIGDQNRISPLVDPCAFECPFDLRTGTDFQELRSTAARNVYLFGALARKLGTAGDTWVGASASYADLRWMTGIEHLYAGASRIVPNGSVVDLRLGLHHLLADGRELSAALVHQRTDMQHDVTWTDFFWDPVVVDDQVVGALPEVQVRLERNLDQARTWGGHVDYRVPVAASPWTVATSFTVNRKDHPKIPNYQIQNIPRDPGETWAFGFGLGAARQQGGTTFAADLRLQPIWSETWQEAEVPTLTTAGFTIPTGGRTIENDFRFTNVTVQMGVDQRIGRGRVQVGVRAHSVAYTLDQWHAVDQRARSAEESWIEWTPSLGLGLDLDGLQLRYTGAVTSGTGQPGTTRFALDAAEPGLEIDILTAPSGPLALNAAHVLTHRFVVSLPLR